MKGDAKKKMPALPPPVVAADLVRPAWDAKGDAAPASHSDRYEDRTFELWHTERFGWCIPTLNIRALSGRAAARGAETRRTYAVTVDGGAVVCVGMGPHVTAHVTVHVTVGRLEALRPLLELREKGAGDAGSIRDRISSRRAQTSMRRGSNPLFTPWDR